jgi:hypothetical protein
MTTMGNRFPKAVYRALEIVILLLAGFSLGCTVSGGKVPNDPSTMLSVTPTALKFEIKDPASSSYEGFLDVKNLGGGKLYWEVTGPCSFATCDPDSGWLTDDTGRVKVLVSNKIQSSANGTICIDSTGGTCHVAVTVDIFLHLRGRVTDTMTGYGIEDARIFFGLTSSAFCWSDPDGYYDVWVLKEEALDSSGLVTALAEKNGYQDCPSGKFTIGINPPVYTYDFEMTPE